jgi:hypothetical protein
MICRKLFYSLALLLMCICNCSYAQQVSIQQEEHRLITLYSAAMARLGNNDSSTYYTDKFGRELKRYITATPASLHYPFKRLADSNYCNIITSSDGNLRIYSWDTWTGGSMHFYNQIIQYRNKGVVFTKIPNYAEGDAGVFCSAIFTVTIKGVVYYLPISNGTYSNKDASQSVSVLTIRDRELTDTARLFKTKKQLLNAIDVNFDFLSVVDRPERPLALITYNEKEKVIRIPLVKDNGRVTRQRLLYKLQGNYFTFTGIE